MKNTAEIVQARPEDAAELIEYIRQIGAETDNLSFGAEGLPFDVASEADYLRSQMDSADSVSYLARIDLAFAVADDLRVGVSPQE